MSAAVGVLAGPAVLSMCLLVRSVGPSHHVWYPRSFITFLKPFAPPSGEVVQRHFGLKTVRLCLLAIAKMTLRSASWKHILPPSKLSDARWAEGRRRRQTTAQVFGDTLRGIKQHWKCEAVDALH